ncbi:Ski complex subunit Rec14, partial [Cryomyces antarcticus]
MKAGELWAIALSENGQFLAATAYDGRINIWDTVPEGRPKIREYETKRSFGMCIDLVGCTSSEMQASSLKLTRSQSVDGRFTASGHENGSVHIFNNDTGRLAHSLAGLVKPVRAVAFSPASKLLAAAGDSKIIALYDVSSGEQ